MVDINSNTEEKVTGMPEKISLEDAVAAESAPAENPAEEVAAETVEEEKQDTQEEPATDAKYMSDIAEALMASVAFAGETAGRNAVSFLTKAAQNVSNAANELVGAVSEFIANPGNDIKPEDVAEALEAEEAEYDDYCEYDDDDYDTLYDEYFELESGALSDIVFTSVEQIADAIRCLAQLRDEKLITEEDYLEKKITLLMLI